MTKKERGRMNLAKTKETKEEKKKKEGKKAHTHEFSLGGSTLLVVRIKNPLLHDRFIVRVLKDVLRPLRGQVHIRSMCGRARNGRRGNC